MTASHAPREIRVRLVDNAATDPSPSRGRERGRVRVGKWMAALAGLVLFAMADAGLAEDCRIAPEQGGIRFPVERLEPASRCLISPVVNEYTTSGVVGPFQTPVSLDLFGYLLDHPPVWAALVDRLMLGNYIITEKGPRQYWVDDGQGTQCLVTEIYRDEATRIYHFDGSHEGSIMPMVKAKAVVFLRLQPVPQLDGTAGVQSNLVAYSKLRDSFLSAVVRLLRPLVGDAVTRKLTRGFDVTLELGNLIGRDPDRVKREAAGLKGVRAEDLRALNALLTAVPNPVPSAGARSAP